MSALATITLCLAAILQGGGDDTNCSTQSIDVRIRVGAMVRGTDVTIGELCEITPINRDTVTLGKIVFAPSPTRGHPRTVTRTEIVQSLAAAGHDVTQFSFSGPAQVLVQSVSVELPVGDILETASAALQALLENEGGDVEVEAPGRLRRVDTPPGRNRRDLIARVRNGRTGLTSAVVDVDVIIDGKKFKRIPVQFKLQRYQMILKTAGVIRAGTPLGPHNLQIVREPLAQSTGLYLTKFEDVVGLIAARNLQSRSRINLSDAAPPAAVHKGEIVTVVLTKGRVKVTAKAVANHDAPLGGRVSLTNLRSRGMLTGIVAAPGLVVIH